MAKNAAKEKKSEQTSADKPASRVPVQRHKDSTVVRRRLVEEGRASRRGGKGGAEKSGRTASTSRARRKPAGGAKQKRAAQNPAVETNVALTELLAEAESAAKTALTEVKPSPETQEAHPLARTKAEPEQTFDSLVGQEDALKVEDILSELGEVLGETAQAEAAMLPAGVDSAGQYGRENSVQIQRDAQLTEVAVAAEETEAAVPEAAVAAAETETAAPEATIAAAETEAAGRPQLREVEQKTAQPGANAKKKRKKRTKKYKNTPTEKEKAAEKDKENGEKLSEADDHRIKDAETEIILAEVLAAEAAAGSVASPAAETATNPEQQETVPEAASETSAGPREETAAPHGQAAQEDQADVPAQESARQETEQIPAEQEEETETAQTAAPQGEPAEPEPAVSAGVPDADTAEQRPDGGQETAPEDSSEQTPEQPQEPQTAGQPSAQSHAENAKTARMVRLVVKKEAGTGPKRRWIAALAALFAMAVAFGGYLLWLSKQPPVVEEIAVNETLNEDNTVTMTVRVSSPYLFQTELWCVLTDGQEELPQDASWTQAENGSCSFAVAAGDYAVYVRDSRGNLSAPDRESVEINQCVAVSVDKEKLYLPLDGADRLSAELFILGDVPDVVSWSSEDESVATVDETGLVRAVNLGETRIIATSADGKNGADRGHGHRSVYHARHRFCEQAAAGRQSLYR